MRSVFHSKFSCPRNSPFFVRTCPRAFPLCVFHRDVVILCLCNLLLPSATAPRDSNLTHTSRNRILVNLALALPLELIHTLGFQLFLKFCQGVFKFLALLLISHSVTCLLVKSSHPRPLLCRYLSTFRVPILSLVPGDAFVQFPFF